MTPARILAIAFALCAYPAIAQQPVKAVLSVSVADQTGANIPGANILLIGQGPDSRFEAVADSRGEAVVHIDQGSYDLRVQAKGFHPWAEKIAVAREGTYRSVTLQVGWYGGPPVIEGPEIPLDHPPLSAEIPSIPLQQFVPPAKPARVKRRWF